MMTFKQFLGELDEVEEKKQRTHERVPEDVWLKRTYPEGKVKLSPEMKKKIEDSHKKKEMGEG